MPDSFLSASDPRVNQIYFPFSWGWYLSAGKTDNEKANRWKIPYVITYMLNLQYGTNELIYETETEMQIKRTDLWLPRDKEVRGGMNWGFGISDANCYIAVVQSLSCVWLFATLWTATLLYTEWINRVLLYSTGNCIQYPIINYSGKNMRKNIYVFVYILNWTTLPYIRN